MRAGAEPCVVIRETEVKTATVSYPEPLQGAAGKRTDSTEAWKEGAVTVALLHC